MYIYARILSIRTIRDLVYTTIVFETFFLRNFESSKNYFDHYIRKIRYFFNDGYDRFLKLSFRIRVF